MQSSLPSRRRRERWVNSRQPLKKLRHFKDFRSHSLHLRMCDSPYQLLPTYAHMHTVFQFQFCHLSRNDMANKLTRLISILHQFILHLSLGLTSCKHAKFSKRCLAFRNRPENTISHVRCFRNKLCLCIFRRIAEQSSRIPYFIWCCLQQRISPPGKNKGWRGVRSSYGCCDIQSLLSSAQIRNVFKKKRRTRCKLLQQGLRDRRSPYVHAHIQAYTSRLNTHTTARLCLTALSSIIWPLLRPCLLNWRTTTASLLPPLSHTLSISL